MVEIIHSQIHFENYYSLVTDDKVGAVCVFFGNVRQGDRDDILEYIFYECYEKAAKKELQKIAENIKEQFPIKKILIVHRLGKLLPAESSLLVIVTAAHRKESFAACETTIEDIKKTVPIWKKEVFKNQSHWVS